MTNMFNVIYYHIRIKEISINDINIFQKAVDKI